MSYKSHLSGLAPNAYWPLDQTTTPADIAGGLTTALESGAALGAAGPLTIDPSTCATFDGTDDRINVSDHATIDLTTNWSVTFWFNGDLFNHAGGGNFPRILSKGSGSGVGYQFLVDNAAGPKLAIQTQGLSDTTHQTVSNVSTATWYHVVTTYDGSNVRIYLNGTIDYTGPATGSVTTNATALYMGQRGDGASRWDGRIAHVAIWNATVLSGAQVTALYAARTEAADSFLVLPYLQARAGIARAGASLAGDYYPDVQILINGVNREASIQRNSVSITLERNDVPSSARFTVVSSSGYVPVVGNEVYIKHGGATLPMFGGQISDAEHIFERDGQPTPWVEVTCQGWQRKANSRRVTESFTGWSASDAAAYVVDAYMPGFSSARIKPAMAILDEFPCVNEAPTSVLKRIAVMVGGGTRIDAARYVYLWDVNGEVSAYLPSQPQPLVAGLWSLQAFRHGYDSTQIRTRMIVEGRSTQTLWPLPAGVTDPNLSSVPIEYAWMFAPSPGKCRIGPQVFFYAAAQAVTGIIGPPAAQLTANANPGDTSISVVSNFDIDNADTGNTSRWLRDEAGNYFYAKSPRMGGIGSLTTFTNIPASGHGAIVQPILSGAAVYMVDALHGLSRSEFGVTPSTIDIEAGEAVVVRVEVNDTAAQTALAAIEGGDGVYEEFASDSDLSYVGCAQLGQAQLDTFSEALVRVSWTTEDRNTVPGTEQAINVALTGGLTTTITVDRVTVTFPVRSDTPYPLPLRRCEGAAVKLQGLIELLEARVI